MDGEEIECYRLIYDVEYWKNIAEKVGNQCSSPFSAVLAVNALCDEVDRLNEKLRVAEEALQVVADDGGNRKQYEACEALAKIREK